MTISLNKSLVFQSLFVKILLRTKYYHCCTISNLRAVTYAKQTANIRVTISSTMRSFLKTHIPLTGLSHGVTLSISIVNARYLCQRIKVTFFVKTVLLNSSISQTAKKFREWQINTFTLFLIISSTTKNISANF